MADSKVVKKRIRSASKQAVYYRNYRRARDRALVRLAQANPAQYAVFLQEEKERDKAEGKAWADIAGNPLSGDHPDRDDFSTDPSATASGAGGGDNPNRTDPEGE